MSLSLSRNVPRVDHREVQARQRTAWASGDYAVASNALQIVSEELCETVNLGQDERVLDVAAGSFHGAFAAARRWCDVTATDYASDLTNRGRQRAEAVAAGVRFVDADAEALPFPDQSFSAVISAFGAMFAADQERADLMPGPRASAGTRQLDAGRLHRTVVCPGGSTCTAGELRSCAVPMGRAGNSKSCLAPMAASKRHAAGGHAAHSHGLGRQVARGLCARAEGLRAARPALPKAMRGDLLELVTRFNRSGDSSMLVDAEYLEVVVTRR
jgi:SAM-dependent methyltransferase